MEVLKRLKDMYYSMPMWMKPGMIKNNETSIEFDNGMRVIAEAKGLYRKSVAAA